MKRVGILVIALLIGCASKSPTPSELIASKTDSLGEAALRQPGGPSYDFFKAVLPPLRYVDADYLHYPIVLSAPGATVKGKLISDGSGINLRAREPSWNNEAGTPVHILVGDKRVPFNRAQPTYLDGYLPVVGLVDGEYREDVFASVDPELAELGAVVVKFDLPAANSGKIELRVEDGYDLLKMDRRHIVHDSSGTPVLQLDDNWEFSPARSAFMSKVEHPRSIIAVVFTAGAASATTRSAGPGMQPEMEAAGRLSAATTVPSPVTLDFYHQQRELCIRRWKEILASGTSIDVPEPVVMNAWRTLLVAQHEIIQNDQLNYSALNQYARQYSNESGDTMRSLMLWGHTDVARRGLKPLFVYRRKGIELHDGAFKLEDLADYYFVTRDADTIHDLRPLWQREIDLILSSRQPDGMLPKEAYCSDIRTPVHSLNTNANCWRGMRDMALVLDDIGEHEQAAKLAKTCEEYKKVILAALDKAIVRDVDPPFVRIALDGEEPISNPITSTRYGSYWNLVVPCVLWSGIFPIDSEPANDIIHYIQRNGGLCMGLTRVQSVRGAWVNVQNIDDLYVIRYVLALLKRDEPDRALVTFYGKLAQGFTRETFCDGESSGIEPLDGVPACGSGRQFALPPNSTANASFLLQLRYLLVQDWDMNDDGLADTLRLAFATPRAWLADGKHITVKNAPTAFGPVSFEIRRTGRLIRADVDLPAHVPDNAYLRIRFPEGEYTFDLSHAGGHAVRSYTIR